jgi:hypothetical protein
MHRQGTQEQRVGQTENGAISANAERERQHGDDGEAGALEQLADAVGDVLEKLIHR